MLSLVYGEGGRRTRPMPKVSARCSCICTCIAHVSQLLIVRRVDVTFYFGRIDMQVATGDGVARDGRERRRRQRQRQRRRLQVPADMQIL